MMVRTILVLWMVLIWSSESRAWPWRRAITRSVSVSRSVTVQRYASPQQAAEAKAAAMAAQGRLVHLGGGFGGGNAEGIGMGSTPGTALAACCYANTRVCVGAATAWSAALRAYVACRIYR